ncbi:hypothetical protein DSM104299_04994 [Baekduia alba]|uniref:hypothetical protein n=1 Tax=Baekduia alba TaxID=2997333 RepID=UPI0023424FA7|nr:hypothetical protein [Baekduia alba]WCB96237.1 hypothetical protein DSM104299_04994 [Baekduia alba]
MKKITLAATATCALVLVPAAAQAKVVDCSSYSDYPNTQISSARGMTCAAATKVMKSYRGNISKSFKVQAFRCTQVSGSQFGGQWRCAAGAKAFRFEFKD